MAGGACHRGEEALVLGLACTEQRRRTDAPRLADLARRCDPKRLLAVLGRQRLIELGIARLHELAADELATVVAGRIQERLRAARWKSVQQEMLTHSIAGMLDEHRLASVPLKGAVLGRRLFGDPGLRESEDIDLLVGLDRLDEAVSLVRERFGYDAPHDARDTRGHPLLHYRLNHPDGLPTVELHWRVHWYEERSAPAMLARCVVEEGLRRLAPADELACLMLFYARDGFAGIRPLADLAAWWDATGERLKDGGIGAFAREFPELAPGLAVAGALAEALVGVPGPGLAVGSAPWPARMTRAARLANWQLAGSKEQIYADAAMVDLLLSPSGQAWSVVRRQVVLPLDVVADRLVETRSTRLRLLLAATLHVPRILARFMLALIATHGSRTRSPLPEMIRVTARMRR